MKRYLAIAPILAALIFTTGCDDNDDVTLQPSQLALRVLHASPDAPKVNIVVDGDAVLEAVDYKTGPGFLSLDVTVTVQAGGVYTAVARDAAGGGVSVGLILLDDFAD